MADEGAEPIPVNLPDGLYVPENGPDWNRGPGKTVADVNLDAAPYGFKVTGDAAWDSDSDDYAMLTAEGNAAVAAMVKTAKLKARGEDEAAVLAWIEGEKERLAEDMVRRPVHSPISSQTGRDTHVGMSEVFDTMVRETIAYALDEAWVQAYGHRFGEDAPLQGQDEPDYPLRVKIPPEIHPDRRPPAARLAAQITAKTAASQLILHVYSSRFPASQIRSKPTPTAAPTMPAIIPASGGTRNRRPGTLLLKGAGPQRPVGWVTPERASAGWRTAGS
jgi:hypothetical protein